MADDILMSIGGYDITGARKTVNLFFPAATTLAQLQGYLTSVAPNINGFTEWVIDKAEVVLPLTLPGGLRTTPIAGSTVRRGGLFTFDNSTRFAWDVYVPAIDTDVLVGTNIDPAAASVDEFIAAMVDGVTVSSVLIQPTNGSGEDLTALIHAKETFRK